MISKKLSFQNFITLLSYRTKTSERRIKKIYDAMIQLIIEELKTSGEINLRNFCTISLKYIDGGDRYVPKCAGSTETVLKYCKPTVTVSIKPSPSIRKTIKEYIYMDNDDFVSQVKTQEKKDEIRQLLVEKFDKTFDEIKQEALKPIAFKEEEEDDGV